MLSIIMIAYQDMDLKDLPQGSLDKSRQHLLSTYIDRMLSQGRTCLVYSKSEVFGWLSFLAKQLVEGSQTIFLIEHMQPTWLTTKKQRFLYSIILGVTLATILALIFQPITGFFLGLIDLQAKYLFFLPLSIILGLFWALATSKFETALANPQGRLFLGFLSGFFVIVYSRFFSGSWSVAGLLTGLGYGIFISIIARFLSYQIFPSESLSWSWTHAQQGVLNGLRWGLWIGLIFGAIMGIVDSILLNQILDWGAENYLIESPPLEFGDIILSGWPLMLINSLIFALIFEVLGGTLGGLLGGYSAKVVNTQTRPNQGIWQSCQNALIFSIIGAICTGSVFGLLGVPVLPSALLGLLFGLVTAGFPCIQHFLLRCILAVSGKTPWNYAKFLDFATRNILLQKVGGGYIFIHRLLLEHFAYTKN
jgi:hypothetical protein